VNFDVSNACFGDEKDFLSLRFKIWQVVLSSLDWNKLNFNK
jgi:hypothetical protein